MEGVDVSSWQGDINFEQVAAADKKFVIVRGGDGTFRDPRTEEYSANARSVGMHVDCYHFLRFNLSPAQMAGECERTVSRSRAGRIWLDEEDTDYLSSVPFDGRIDWLLEVANRIPGVDKGLYSGPWYEPNVKSFAPLAPLMPFWGAVYPLNNGESSGQRLIDMGFQTPTMGGVPCVVWQFSSNAYVPGITDNTCDQDYALAGVFEQEDDMNAEQAAQLQRLNDYFFGPFQDPLGRPAGQAPATRADWLSSLFGSMDFCNHVHKTALDNKESAFKAIADLVKAQPGGALAVDYAKLAEQIAANPAFIGALAASIAGHVKLQ